jgi:hypothetical protein
VSPLRWIRARWHRWRVEKGLEAAWGKADPLPVELSELRAVVFSDHHRGRGDGADDFRRCEAAYRAALGWYAEQGYALWLLGDVEELWENSPEPVLNRYKEVLKLEGSFGERLLRFYGNHDMQWKDDAGPLGGVGVREGLKVVVRDGGEPLGTIFLVHGHQGTIDSGNLLVVPFSRFVVRFVWGTLQRRFGFASTAPSTSNWLRGEHDEAMVRWADKHEQRIVLIAGHTHRPVFPGTMPPDLEAEAAKAEATYRDAVAAGKDAWGPRAAWELARAKLEREDRYKPPKLERPSYFNTGCCSFGDGDVTGLELADGEIRLVRWLADDGGASPQRLEKPADLRTVLGRLTGRAAP